MHFIQSNCKDFFNVLCNIYGGRVRVGDSINLDYLTLEPPFCIKKKSASTKMMLYLALFTKISISYSDMSGIL